MALVLGDAGHDLDVVGLIKRLHLPGERGREVDGTRGRLDRCCGH